MQELLNQLETILKNPELSLSEAEHEQLINIDKLIKKREVDATTPLDAPEEEVLATAITELETKHPTLSSALKGVLTSLQNIGI